jgi:hypothetical protein
LQVDVIKAPNVLDDDADQLLIPDPHADVVMWGALSVLAARERDWNTRAYAEENYNNFMTEMIATYGMGDRQSPDRVVKSGFHDQHDERNIWL